MTIGDLNIAEITTWLTRVTTTIDRSLVGASRDEALAMLRTGLNGHKAGLHVLAQLALLDDCLRVAHLAIEADGIVDADELARVGDLIRIAGSKYCFALAPYESFAEGIVSHTDVARFLRVHRTDDGPYGYANTSQWRGLELVRTVERHTRNASPQREHERMLDRIMEGVFDGRQTDTERAARRRLRDLFERPSGDGIDPRITAFCRTDGPEVFASVAHGSHVHERDPYDVEVIHAEAREVFHQQVDRATTPMQQMAGHGRTLLVLGDSGSGKTHLLRALRGQVHTQRMGYVGYLQMATEVGDYAKYVLRGLVDSLEKPYDAPGLAESALMYLSDGIVEGRVQISADELEQLRTKDMTGDELDRAIGKVIDQIVRTEGLERLETDLLHALLLLQRRDPALQKRVVRFLRCEPLTNYDRQLLGGLAPRDQPEDPIRTISQLATIMYELSNAALVLCVDQLEDTIPDGVTATKMQVAFDTLRGIADANPSAVVVLACITDVYDAVKPKLSRSLVDRLEHDPPPVRLSAQREIEEIEQMLARRLDALYTAFDVPWRDDDPYFPFTRDQIDAVAKYRARDVLAKFRDYHATCVAARRIVSATSAPSVTTSIPTAVGTPPDGLPVVTPAIAQVVMPPAGAPIDAIVDATAPMPTPLVKPAFDAPAIEKQLTELVATAGKVPDEDDEILELVADALRGAAVDHGIEIELRKESGSDPSLVIANKQLGKRLVVLCNKKPQGGHLGKQLDALTAIAKKGTTAIALRGSDWQFTGKTAQKIGELKAAGGRTVVIEDAELRAILAARALDAKAPTGFGAWRKTKQGLPFARIALLREILDLDRVEMRPVVEEAPPPPPPAASKPIALPPLPPIAETKPRVSAPMKAFDPTQVRLGALTTIRAEAVNLPLEEIKKHIAFLGSPGSGKTTVALAIAEQLLERGISVLLVDRKGDLARYASEIWWADRSFGDPERKRSLRERIELALFTPGNPQGRPLRLPVIPSMAEATKQEREQIARFAASGLVGMMGLGRGVATTHKESVLKCAIELLADEPEVTLEMIHDTIKRPDPQLLTAVDALQRHFGQLAECLQSLKIQRGALLTGEGEMLDVSQILPPSGHKPRLTIINTSALAEVDVLQFWVSRLLLDLGRLVRKRPSSTLQAVAFFDEADAYVPASASPPTKDPMFDLLKRARAGGLGIMLATQNPGDFDYKARDNIGTWLVGKVSQDRAIEKMRNLLAGYPNVSSRLATQAPGSFFVLANESPREIRADRALMATEQMAEHEVADLARLQRPK